MRLKRKTMPLSVKLASALIALGFHPNAAARAAGIKLEPMPELFDDGRYDGIADEPIQFDHDPALGLRVNEPYRIPLDNDPRFIVPRLKAPHRVKTSADQTAIAKTKRLEAVESIRQAFHEGEYHQREGTPIYLCPYARRTPQRTAWIKGWRNAGKPQRPKRKMQSRPFQKQRKP
jgi:ribosome modulation factor